MEEDKGPKPRIWLVGGDGKIQPVDHREASTEQVFLITNGEKGVNLSKKIAKLYYFNVKITYGTNQDQDLVTTLYRAFKQGAQFPKLVRVAQYLSAKTIDYLAEQNEATIKDSSFPMGFLDPQHLLNSQDINEYFKILTHQYPTHLIVLKEFLMGRTLGSGNLRENDAISVARLESGGLSDEKEHSDRYHLLATLTNDFIDIGEYISLGRIELLDPYLILLGKIPKDKAQDFIGKMLRLEYPFTADNRYNPNREDKWASEIRDAQDNK